MHWGVPGPSQAHLLAAIEQGDTMHSKPTQFARQGRTPRSAKGVTLIEVLVAVLILSIGLLGIAGLQVATAKYQLGSGIRAATASLFSDYTDRVRLNTTMAGPNSITGAVSNLIPSNATDQSLYAYKKTWEFQQGESDASLTSTDCDGSNTCTPDARANYDMLTWRKTVRASLPQGAVFTEGNRSNGITVTLMWFDKERTNKSSRTDDADNAATQVALVSATQCNAVTTTTGLALQTCCPNAAAAPAGVRCSRFSFMP
jgi:type IV pilus assembly protein PilV